MAEKEDTAQKEPEDKQAPPDDGGVSESGAKTEEKARPPDLPEDQEWDRVELDEKAQRRFNRLYAQMKGNKEIIDRMADDNKLLINRVNSLENTTDEHTVNEQVTGLKVAKAQALEAGDFTKVADIDEQIVDLKTAAKPQSVEKPVKSEEKKEESWLTPARERQLLTWAGETDTEGKKIRPWAEPGHVDHGKALRSISLILDDPEYEMAEMDEVLQEADRLMGGRKPTKKAAAVLGSNSSIRPKEKTSVALNEQEKFVASKMGMSPEAYMKAREKWQGPRV